MRDTDSIDHDPTVFDLTDQDRRAPGFRRNLAGRIRWLEKIGKFSTKIQYILSLASYSSLPHPMTHIN